MYRFNGGISGVWVSGIKYRRDALRDKPMGEGKSQGCTYPNPKPKPNPN